MYPFSPMNVACGALGREPIFQISLTDRPSALMQTRCRTYRDKPPGAQWGGTFADRRGQHAK